MSTVLSSPGMIHLSRAVEADVCCFPAAGLESVVHGHVQKLQIKRKSERNKHRNKSHFSQDMKFTSDSRNNCQSCRRKTVKKN